MGKVRVLMLLYIRLQLFPISVVIAKVSEKNAGNEIG
jgi:hypothetical protein